MNSIGPVSLTASNIFTGLLTINNTNDLSLTGNNTFTSGVKITASDDVILSDLNNSDFVIQNSASCSSLDVKTPVRLAGSLTTSGSQLYESTVKTNGSLSASDITFKDDVSVQTATSVNAQVIFNGSDIDLAGQKLTLNDSAVNNNVLKIASSSQIEANDLFTNNGSLTNSGTITSEGTFTNNGSLTNNSSITSNAAFINNADKVISGSGNITFKSDFTDNGRWINTGTLYLSGNNNQIFTPSTDSLTLYKTLLIDKASATSLTFSSIILI